MTSHSQNEAIVGLRGYQPRQYQLQTCSLSCSQVFLFQQFFDAKGLSSLLEECQSGGCVRKFCSALLRQFFVVHFRRQVVRRHGISFFFFPPANPFDKICCAIFGLHFPKLACPPYLASAGTRNPESFSCLSCPWDYFVGLYSLRMLCCR